MTELDPSDQIVVTGMGCVSPLGNDIGRAMGALFAGRDGIGEMPEAISNEYPQLRAYSAAPAFNFDITRDPLLGYTEKELDRIHRSAQFSLWAISQALRQAGIVGASTPDKSVTLIENGGQVDPARIGIRMGTGMGGGDRSGYAYEQITAAGVNVRRQRLKALDVLHILPERVATIPSMRFGIQGPVSEVTGACATGNMNIIAGADLLRLGRADVVVVGGSEAQITPIGIGLFDGIGALDKNTDPRLASRPFHKAEAGFVMGEGAGALILEKRGHAERRGAPVIATLSGYSETSDAHHDTSPSGEGASRALEIALSTVALANAAIYVNAHGTGTGGDKVELKAIADVLELDQLAGISSTKGATGHLLGAAGVFEAIACITALHRGEIPPTLKLAHPDDIVDIARGWQVSALRSTPAPNLSVAVNNSFGFGGLNAVTVWEK